MAFLASAQKLILPLLIVVSLMLIVMLQFGFIFLMLAMLPSITIYFLDTDPHRATFRTVFACNLAATIPSLTPMFISGLKFKHYEVGTIIGDPRAWMLIYGGAAGGWVLIYLCRYLSRVGLTMQYELRASMQERLQERLLEEWGEPLKKFTEKLELQRNKSGQEDEDEEEE